MKTKLILLAILAISLVSCNDLLNQKPKSSLTVGIYYKSPQQIKQALSSVYAGMDSWPVNIYLLLSEVRSNNLYGVSHDAHRDWWDITTFTVKPQDNTIHDVWQNLYQMVNRANKILQTINGINFGDADSLKVRYKAQTRFLRALAYFQLVRIYGNIPLVKKVIDPREAIKIHQSKPDSVYKFITSEMKDVQDELPASYDQDNKGRVTKWAAKGVLAKVYLTMAGYPLKDMSHYSEAQSLLEQVMNHAGDGYSFAKNYADLFKLSNENKYWLLGIQFTSGGNGQGTSYPVYILPDLNASLLPYSRFFSASRLAITPNLINSYDSSDVRFAATIDTTYLDNENPPQIGHTPYFHKFFDPAANSMVQSHYDYPDNFPLLRYADVLLMYAQILNEQNGPTAKAVSILNKIRSRAGLSPEHPATKKQFQQALNREERHEFADEGQWWWYLIRTGQAVSTINAWSKATSQGFTINKDQLVYPIPLTELDVYPNLYQQNPGY